MGTTTITATTPQNLFIKQNQATSTKSHHHINSSNNGGDGPITVQNVRQRVAEFSTMILAGVVGPNAGVVQNSANSTLRLSAANNCTKSHDRHPWHACPGNCQYDPQRESSVNISGTVNMAGFGDTIDALSGSGIVDGKSGTPTLTSSVATIPGTRSAAPYKTVPARWLLDREKPASGIGDP